MYRLRLLGGVSLEGPDGPLEGRVSQRRPLALVVLLALAPRRIASRDKLVGLLWPEEESGDARRRLSIALHAVRKALGADSVRSLGDDLVLDARVVRCDGREFLDAHAAGDFERAVELYAGPPLDGFHVSAAGPFERWVDVQQERFGRRYAEALEALAGRAEERGDLAAAVRYWRKRAAHEPCSSRVALRLVRALQRAGDRPAAVRQARIHAALVRDRLGMEPDSRILSLADRLEHRERGEAFANAAGGRDGMPGPEDPGAAGPSTEAGPASDAAFSSEAGRSSGDRPPLETEADRAPPVPVPRAGGREDAGHPLRWRRIAALAAVALVGVPLVLWSPWSADPAAPEAPSERLVVFPFSAYGTPDASSLGVGMVDLLGGALDGSGGWRSVPAEAALDAIGAGGRRARSSPPGSAAGERRTPRTSRGGRGRSPSDWGPTGMCSAASRRAGSTSGSPPRSTTGAPDGAKPCSSPDRSPTFRTSSTPSRSGSWPAGIAASPTD